MGDGQWSTPLFRRAGAARDGITGAWRGFAWGRAGSGALPWREGGEGLLLLALGLVTAASGMLLGRPAVVLWAWETLIPLG